MLWLGNPQDLGHYETTTEFVGNRLNPHPRMRIIYILQLTFYNYMAQTPYMALTTARGLRNTHTKKEKESSNLDASPTQPITWGCLCAHSFPVSQKISECLDLPDVLLFI